MVIGGTNGDVVVLASDLRDVSDRRVTIEGAVLVDLDRNHKPSGGMRSITSM